MFPVVFFGLFLYLALLFFGVFDSVTESSSADPGSAQSPALRALPTSAPVTVPLPAPASAVDAVAPPVIALVQGEEATAFLGSAYPHDEPEEVELVDIPSDWQPCGKDHGLALADYVDFSEQDRYEIVDDAVAPEKSNEHFDEAQGYWAVSDVDMIDHPHS